MSRFSCLLFVVLACSPVDHPDCSIWSDEPGDDELVELKKIGDLGGLSCLQIPAMRPMLRIIDGSKQLGRLKYKIMAAGPELDIPEIAARGQHLRDWWIRSLDPSYRQVRLSDLRSVGELAGIVYDQQPFSRRRDPCVFRFGARRITD